MKISVFAAGALIALTTVAFAQRPSVYPLRSQSAAAQGVDNAYCYWQAKQQTGVDMARQSQRPERTAPLRFAADAGKGASEPPLPAARGASGRSSRGAASGSLAAEPHGSSAVTGGMPPAAARPNASSPDGGGSAQTAAAAASSSSSSMASSTVASGASGATPNLPPLPPPEPPMTAYWQAYGDCMQSRGYGVQ
jgi:hypothetical protein